MTRRLFCIVASRLLGPVLLLLHLSTAFAEVSVQLERSTTQLNQPVRLNIQIQGDNDASPDLSVLQQDFEILGRSQHSSTFTINGRRSRTLGLTLTLMPKRLGHIEIPSIRVGNESAPALSLEVVDQQQAANTATNSPAPVTESQSGSAFIELELSKERAYPQEEVIIILRLFQPAGVSGDSLTDPQASKQDVQIRRLQEDRYSLERDGQTYQVVEQRFAVYAYSPGRITLGGVQYRGHTGGSNLQSLLNAVRERFLGGGQTQSQIVSAGSQDVDLEIVPAPANSDGKRWLPARDLRIMEGDLRQGDTLSAGQPFTRRITLSAEGLTASQLPSVEIALPEGIRQYPEGDQVKDDVSREGINGIRQTSVTLVANQEGRYELPAIEIPWWNTRTQRREVATLAPLFLNVTPAVSGQAAYQPPDQPALPASGSALQPAAPLLSSSDEGIFPWLAWILGLGWLTTLVVWWMSRRRKRALKPAPVITAPSQPARNPLDEILAELDVAYAKRDREAARLAWLNWGQLRWPDHPPVNLNRLAQRCPQQIALAVTALDRSFYAPGAQDGWLMFDPKVLIKRPPVQAQPGGQVSATPPKP